MRRAPWRTSSSRSNANSDRACSSPTTLSIAASPSSPVLAHRRSQLVGQAGGYVALPRRESIHNFRSYLRSAIGNAVRETRPLLEQDGCIPPPAPIRYRTATELLAAATASRDTPTT